jgi:hypothetical protein
MKSYVIKVFFALAAAVLLAQGVARSGEPKVINPFSDEYKNSTATQSSSIASSSTASTKVKYISAFADNSTQSSAAAEQNNAAVASSAADKNMAGSNSAQPENSTSQANAAKETPVADYKMFKSK